MTATLEIMLHIERLPDTELFNNREFLKYAARSTVDWALYKAAKLGRIIRIAYGVYRKASPFVTDEPSIERVAEFKATIFDRKISEDGLEAARATGLTEQQNECLTFQIDGHSSSFKMVDGTVVRFKRASNRKVALTGDNVRRTIKSLWHQGQQALQENFYIATKLLTRDERATLSNSGILMPAWLADFFSADKRCRRTQAEEAQYWQDVDRAYQAFELSQWNLELDQKWHASKAAPNLNEDGTDSMDSPLDNFGLPDDFEEDAQCFREWKQKQAEESIWKEP